MPPDFLSITLGGKKLDLEVVNGVSIANLQNTLLLLFFVYLFYWNIVKIIFELLAQAEQNNMKYGLNILELLVRLTKKMSGAKEIKKLTCGDSSINNVDLFVNRRQPKN